MKKHKKLFNSIFSDGDDYWDDNSKRADEDRWSESETTMKTEGEHS